MEQQPPPLELRFTNPNDYIYNSTKVYKNNYPVDIDIDMISSELYDHAGNRSNFEEIMKKIENDILTSDDSNSVKPLKKEEKNSRLNNIYYSSDNSNANKYFFRSTLPEGELMKEPNYQSAIMHKKYTDVNANSKFYFPTKKNTSIMEDNNKYQNQWTNRANKIVLENQGFREWGGNMNMKSPKSFPPFSPSSIAFSPASPISNNNNNATNNDNMKDTNSKH